MRHLNAAAIAALLLTLVDTRDASGQKFPDRWDGDGLVVGQLVGTAEFGLATSSEKWAKLTVGRRDAHGGMFNGLIVFKRGEGEHELKSIYSEVAKVSLPIRRIFETKKGQITVLGLMVCVPSPENPKQYRIVAIDNTEETMDFMRRVHPTLLEGHEDAEVLQAPGEYLPKERLVKLRTNIARNQARRAKRQGRFWVAGIAGTLAEVSVTGDSVRVLRFLPPVTYQEPVMNAYDEEGVLTFSVYARQWRVVNGAVEEVGVTQAGSPR
jgi:hypothetical protein